MKDLERPSQSPNLKPNGDVAQLKRSCEEIWAKILPQPCESLTGSFHKGLISAVAVDSATTSY